MKSADSRIRSVISSIPDTLSLSFTRDEQENLQFALLHWLSENSGHIYSVSRELSLDGLGPSKFKKTFDHNKKYRDLVRVLILLEISHGSGTINSIRELKKTLMSKLNYGNDSQLLNRIKIKYQRINAANLNGRCAIGFDNAAKKEKIRQGFLDAKSLLTYVKGRMSNNDENTRNLIKYWFGDTKEVSSTLTRNIHLLCDTIHSRKFKLNPAVVPGSSDTALQDIYASTILNSAITYPNTPITIRFGSSYFNDTYCQRKPRLVPLEQHTNDLKATVNHFDARSLIKGTSPLNKLNKSYHAYFIKKNGQSISNKSIASHGGTIIHELSHSRLGTRDFDIKKHFNLPNDSIIDLFSKHKQKVYGHYFCHALAQHNPKDALLNADNYRLFCESFSQPR